MYYVRSRVVTDRQTDRQTEYCNARAHAQSVNQLLPYWYVDADYATDTSHKPTANFDQWVAMPTRYVMKKVKMCSNKPN